MTAGGVVSLCSVECCVLFIYFVGKSKLKVLSFDTLKITFRKFNNYATFWPMLHRCIHVTLLCYAGATYTMRRQSDESQYIVNEIHNHPVGLAKSVESPSSDSLALVSGMVDALCSSSRTVITRIAAKC